MTRPVAALLALALTGCVLGPKYHPAPTPPVAAGPFVAASPSTSSAPLPDRWWRLYDDPALDELVERALVANTDLRVATANLRRARAVLSEARAGRLPSTTISAAGGYSRSSASSNRTNGGTGTGGAGTGGTGTGGTGGTGTGGTGNGGTTGTGTTTTGSGNFESQYYNASLDVSYEIDLFGRVSRTIAAARADAAATEAARDFLRVSVAAETIRAYADACSATRQLNVAQASLQLQTQTFGLTERLNAGGRGTPLDVARARAQLEATRATLPTYITDNRTALFRLALLTGEAPETPSPVAAQACKVPPRLLTPLPIGDGTALLKRRPDIRQADRNLAAATARIGVAIADLYPRVSLGGSVGTSALSFGGLGTSAAFNYNIGPFISWSFPNIAVARARILQARASNEAALASFDGTVLNALQETESALATLAGENDHFNALKTARDASAEAARIVRLRYGAGRENFLAVLDAERTLASAEATLAASEAALADDQISVFKALGGGWETPETAAK